jgi:hypothetical protein
MAPIMNLTSLRAFYKGTSLQAPVEPERVDEFHKHIVETAQRQIEKFLRDGMPLATIKALYKDQMDLMEDGLCRTQKAEDIWTAGDQSAWMEAATAGTEMEGDGDLNTILWFVNTAALLKLKVVENDNDNGWLITKSL